MEKWIGVIREDGREIRFATKPVYSVQFGENDIRILLADMGFQDSLYFSLPSEEHGIRNAEDGDSWDWQVVTKEELEKLRIELSGVTQRK